MHVIGTAGHVDHGKSSLVKALTGINPDRFVEEQLREMTIDLGFAWLKLPNGEPLSIVDVPGHEDFVRNMLAGVGGIDAALLVIAADEGVMPQTREHVAILDLLKVQNGLVALTKSDLVEDKEWLELVEQDVMELLAATSLSDAKVVPVSVRTGRGIPQLIEEIVRVLDKTPTRPDVGRPRLPIDRVFSIVGFGTVVTGTLTGGSLQAGDEVVALPEGFKARIRSLQCHNESVKAGLPGSRLAVNLSGISTDQLKRGDVITYPECFSSTFMADARLQVLSDTPAPLRHNMELEFFSGSARIPARIRILGVPEIAAGESAWVQFCFTRPATVAKNDRFILRQFSPGRTLGGGFIVEPHPQRRHRRFHPEALSQLETLAGGSPEEILLQILRKQEPVETAVLVESSGFAMTDAEDALERLRLSRRIEVLGSETKYLISSEGWKALLEKIAKLVGEYHSNYPLRTGMPREELKSRLRMDSRPFNESIEQATGCGCIVQSDSTLLLPDHAVRLSPSQQSHFNQLAELFHRNRYSPPSIREARAMVGSELLAVFLDRTALVKINEDFFFLKDAYEEIVHAMIAHMRSRGPLSVADVRDMFGMTRKYVLPFLEHLDAKRITRRVGDDRVLI